MIWFVLTIPLTLMPVLWPAFLITALTALVFALFTRAWVLRAVGEARVHRVMLSPVGWPVLVVACTVGLMWLFIAIGWVVVIVALLLSSQSL